MFEKALRLKLRYPFKGGCDTEDLWTLDIQSLDTIFKILVAQLRQEGEESLLAKYNEKYEILKLKIKIVRHIVAVKIQDGKEREQSYVKHLRKQELLGVLADKKQESLKNKSEEELQQLIDDLT